MVAQVNGEGKIRDGGERSDCLGHPGIVQMVRSAGEGVEFHVLEICTSTCARHEGITFSG